MPERPAALRALVTGGTGFIGRAIVRRLLEHSAEVRVITRSAARAHRQFGDSVVPIEHDLRRGPVPATAVAGCNVVVSCAGIPRPATVRTLEALHITGVRELLKAASLAGVERFVHISSDAVVFDGSSLIDIDESHPYPTRYLDAYSRTKAGGEREVLDWARRGEIAAVALRPSLVWGPDDTTFLPILRTLARSPVGMPVAGRGGLPEESTYIDHLVDATMAAISASATGTAYFVTDSYGLRWMDFYSGLIEAISVRPRFLHVPARVATSGAWLIDSVPTAIGLPTPLARFGAHRTLVGRRYRIDAAARDLNWKPSVDFNSGLERLRQWSQSNGSGVRGA